MAGTVVAGVLLVVALVVGGGLVVAGGVSMHRQNAVRRVQLPARLLRKVPAVAGDLLTVEFPGPDGAPRTATFLSAYRRGLGATPTFSGWVWVAVGDPGDVMSRPSGRTLHGLLMLCFGVAILLAGIMGTGVVFLDAWMDGLGSG